jgi:hypothetical protein
MTGAVGMKVRSDRQTQRRTVSGAKSLRLYTKCS